MKKITCFFLSVTLLFTIAGCADNTAFKVKQGESRVYSALTDTWFNYHYDGATGFYISAWLERYEYGKLAESMPSIISCTCTGSGDIVFYSNKTEKPDDPEILNVVIMPGEDSADNVNKLNFIKLNGYSSTGNNILSNKDEFTAKEGRTVLAYIGYNQSTDPSLSMLGSDYRDHLEALKNTPNAIFLGCEFSKDRPINIQ